MLKSDFWYELPKELIAQDPLKKRDESRLLLLHRDSGKTEHRVFRDIKEYLRPGDCLVLNDTKVIPARLIGFKEAKGGSGSVEAAYSAGETGASAAAYGANGAQVEVLLLRRNSRDVFETIVRPGKKLRTGARVVFGNGLLHGEIVEVLPDGNRLVRFEYDGIFEEILDRLGEMPLPPYITHKLQDKTRYNTVYAKNEGSAAAPTAGLHFTEELLEEIREMGVDTAYVTLHVGLGTFRPVKADNIEDHIMHSEFFRVSSDTAEIINSAKKRGGRIIAVGTTSTRVLESIALPDGTITETDGEETSIFIYPGYSFKVIDGLITNFHLPESTLIMLVSAFAGRERVLSAYKEAVSLRYRFFSFGDAMVIL